MDCMALGLSPNIQLSGVACHLKIACIVLFSDLSVRSRQCLDIPEPCEAAHNNILLSALLVPASRIGHIALTFSAVLRL